MEYKEIILFLESEIKRLAIESSQLPDEDYNVWCLINSQIHGLKRAIQIMETME